MKKYRIIFNTSIYPKLENIFDYIALESPKIAIDIIDGIEKQIMSLNSLPERFPIIPEKIFYKDYQVRHFFYKKSFRVIYTIYANNIRILDIRHGAQSYIFENDIDSFS
ncbi:MAG: plasmid stabilization system protein ParE [Rickettsiales bacterium]|jgi:plasmid stabilization system protein ParE